MTDALAIGRRSDEALTLVSPGDTVVSGSLAAEPRALLGGLARRAREVGGVTVLAGMFLSDYRFLVEAEGAIRYRTWFMPGSLREHELSADAVEFMPLAWSQVIDYLAATEIDVALVQVSPRDENGFHSLGVSVGYTLPAVRRARRVIAEVNPAMPRTRGESLVHESELDAVVHVDYPLPDFPHRSVDAAGRQIAETAASFVVDGATVQPGIGAIPSELMHVIAERQTAVTVHSMLTDACIDVVAAAAKRGRRPAARVGEICGSSELYEFVDDNPAIEMVDASATHGFAALAEIDRFVAVNSALEVDLLGQANQEILGGIQAGGVGGSFDFMVAGSRPRNTSLLLLRATTDGGRRSRIVPQLKSGVVSIPRSLVQVVVTEHGVADLRGKSVEERARALIGVAAPEHRDELASAWAELRP